MLPSPSRRRFGLFGGESTWFLPTASPAPLLVRGNEVQAHTASPPGRRVRQQRVAALACGGASAPPLRPAPPLPPPWAVAVLDMRLSRQGVPLVTLSSGRAYAWSAALEGWACVADETFAASQFVPFMNLPGQGEGGGGWRPWRGMPLEGCWGVGAWLTTWARHTGQGRPRPSCLHPACSCPSAATPCCVPWGACTSSSHAWIPRAMAPPAGEISTLQAEALRAAIPRGQLPAQQIRGAAQQALASRAHLEASLSTALALQSPQVRHSKLLAAVAAAGCYWYCWYRCRCCCCCCWWQRWSPALHAHSPVLTRSLPPASCHPTRCRSTAAGCWPMHAS